MTQRKDVAVNLEQAAQDIMVYLLTFRNEEERLRLQTNINQILESAKKDYSGESLSYFWQLFVLPFSRYRGSELDKAIAAIAEFKDRPEEVFGRFAILTGLLESGACKSTSLNTTVLDKLIEATGKYNPINEDEKEFQKSEKDDETTRVRLRRIFLEKAHAAIKQKEEEKKKDEAQKRLTDKEKENIHIGRIETKMKKEFIDTMNDFLKGKIKKVDKPEAKKIDADKLSEKHAMLMGVFGKGARTKPQAKPLIKMEKPPALPPIPASVSVVTPVQTPEDRPAPSQPIPIKPRSAKAAQSESLAASLNAFFAKKNAAKEQQMVGRDDIVDEFTEIAMRSTKT